MYFTKPFEVSAAYMRVTGTLWQKNLAVAQVLTIAGMRNGLALWGLTKPAMFRTPAKPKAAAITVDQASTIRKPQSPAPRAARAIANAPTAARAKRPRAQTRA